jgi:hypothetical protein
MKQSRNVTIDQPKFQILIDEEEFDIEEEINAETLDFNPIVMCTSESERIGLRF